MKEPAANEFAAGAPATDATKRPEPPTGAGPLAKLRAPLMIGGVAVVILGAGFVYLTGGRYESTDDAYIHAAGVDVSANIAGRVVEVDVKEGQKVKAGQVLFRLDPAPFDIAISSAQAQVADSRQQLEAQLATYRQRLVDVQTAQSTAAYAERERARNKGLEAAGAVSQAEYDQAAHQADAAKLGVSTAQQGLAQALASLGGRADESIDAHATVRQANAMLARAELNKQWTSILAPQDGRVTKVEELQVGDYINAAAPTFHLVTGAPWIEAAFKENQLKHMRLGQPVSVKIDAYSGYKCQGHVSSISPATDQTFSLLPAENASGNWVKVVQRLPVRINFSCNPALEPAAGLSTGVKVDTGFKRHLFGPNG
ncbi:MAG TPA: HlyD family secretion protein [Caulobacteraceae bacterium]